MFELRSFRAEDAGAVWRLYDAALEDVGVHGGHGPWEDDLRDISTAYMDGGDFIVAFAGDELVGMGGLARRSDAEAEIRRMRVRPDCQRRGLGRRILSALEERAGDLPSEPVLIVTGPPGVGKTTVASMLAERRPRSVHLEADAFFGFVRSGHVEPGRSESREQNEVVMGIVADAAASYAVTGYFTVVDGIVLPDWFLGPLSDSLRAAGHRVAYAVLREPSEVCLARVRGREGSAELADPGVIERLWSGFAELGRRERHALDLAGRGPEQAVELLEQRLGDGSLEVAAEPPSR